MSAALVCVACSAPTDSQSSTVATSMPIEVLGPEGTRVRTTIAVSELLAAGAPLQLVVVVDNVVATESAFVRVNDHERVDLAARGALRVAGGVATARIDLDMSEVRAGENDVEFGYEREVRDVSGFRVLEVSIVSASRALRATPDLPLEDPSSWTAPLDDATARQRGAELFAIVTRDDGPVCAQCHADDGADLAYFAFSNHSIEARAEHHRFSADEASAIASYIRTLGVAPVGRVYDSPFQPGVGSHDAAGAGYASILPSDDAELAEMFPSGLPSTLRWDEAASVDASSLRSATATPTWLRWLPRHIDDEWFTRQDGRLPNAKANLDALGDLASALEFQSAAISIGKEILVENGDHDGRIQLLRYAAVKLWDWRRRHGGFNGDDHGFPDGGPAFPYEVGFAFFEAALADAVPEAMEQAYSWWVAQIAVNTGRGLSNGERPLNWHDVLLAAESGGAGPNALARLHLIGSFEESRGMLLDDFGTARGPVRLLAVPLRHANASLSESLLARFFDRESEHELSGGTFDEPHRAELADAWGGGCMTLSSAQRDALRERAPEALRSSLAACP